MRVIAAPKRRGATRAERGMSGRSGTASLGGSSKTRGVRHDGVMVVRRRALVGLRWMVLVLALNACSDSPDGRVDGPVLTSVGESEDGMDAIVTGVLTYERDCLLLGGMPVVWPEGTTWQEADGLTLPGGEQALLGDTLNGGGGYLKVDAVSNEFGEDVASRAKECLGETQEVAVFNPGSDVTVDAA